MAAVLGGIANSFLDTATYPAVTEIIHKFTGIATMGIKFFISIAQLLMPFFLGVAAGTSLSYAALPVAGGIAIGILGVLAIFAPMPAGSFCQCEIRKSFSEDRTIKKRSLTV